MGSFSSYDEAIAQHEWRVPERYNIAADVCDKHPPDKLAMIHVHFGGEVREVRWGELQSASNRFARVLREHGVREGRPRRDAAPAHAGDGRRVLRARSSAGRSCSRCRSSTATRASATG